jgi:hypothetical protein
MEERFKIFNILATNGGLSDPTKPPLDGPLNQHLFVCVTVNYA